MQDEMENIVYKETPQAKILDLKALFQDSVKNIWRSDVRDWKQRYANKLVSDREAASHVKNGDRVS